MTLMDRQQLEALEEIERLIARGQKTESACKAVGVSVRTFTNWRHWRDTLPEEQKHSTLPRPAEIVAEPAAPPIAPTVVRINNGMGPAQLADELEQRTKSMILVAELLDGTFLIRLNGSKNQYTLLTALQSIKAGDLK